MRLAIVSEASCLLLFVSVFLLGTEVAPSNAPVPTSNPMSSLVRDASDVRARQARVQSQLTAGSYTYVELRGDGDDHYWAVTMGRAPPAGARVQVRSFGHRRDFYSPRLQRTFPDLVFGIVSRID